MADLAPRVSVVIPAYNRAEVAPEAVRSVLRQTLRDLEVIVVDDASSDDTADRIEAIGDPRLRVIRHETNRGGSAARNTGLRAARAEWVAFQDSDDEWLPTKLERQFAAIERLGRGTIGAYCGMIVLGRPEEGRLDPSVLTYRPRIALGVKTEGDIADSMLAAGSLISTQTFVGRREALLTVGGFDETLKALQDWDCFIRVAELGPIAFEAEPLVIQRFSPNSLTRSACNRVAATRRVLEKQTHRLEAMPAAYAAHLHRLAGGLRRIGDTAGACRAALNALRWDPLNLRHWLGLLNALAAQVSGRRPQDAVPSSSSRETEGGLS